MRRYKVFLGVMLTASLALALFAFLLPAHVQEEKRDAPERRLASNEPIQTWVLYSDTSFSVGETFSLDVFIQYDTQAIAEVNINDLKGLNLGFFEKLDDKIREETIRPNVNEIHYHADIAAFDVTPGDYFTPPSITLAYKFKISGHTQQKIITFPTLSIGMRYPPQASNNNLASIQPAGNIIGRTLRPAKPLLLRDTTLYSVLLTGSTSLVSLTLLYMLARWIKFTALRFPMRRKKTVRVAPFIALQIAIHECLASNAYKNQSARECLKALQPFALQLAALNGISVEQFFTRRDLSDPWSKLSELMQSALDKADPAPKNASDAEKLLSDLINARGGK